MYSFHHCTVWEKSERSGLFIADVLEYSYVKNSEKPIATIFILRGNQDEVPDGFVSVKKTEKK